MIISTLKTNFILSCNTEMEVILMTMSSSRDSKVKWWPL